VEDGRSRLLPLLGTVAVHVGVVGWLAASPERAARIIDAVSMDVVDLTPEPEAEPEQAVEPEKQPEPEPRRQIRQQKRPEKVRPEPEPEPEVAPDPEPPPAPPAFDFGEQSFALPGAGAGFAMSPAAGSSPLGVYVPGRRPSAAATGSGGGQRSAATGFAPVPAGALGRSAEPLDAGRPPYPEEARRQYIEGPVRMMVEVRANGTVRNVRVLSDPGGGLAAAAVEHIRRLRFRPAQDRQGRPVDSRLVWTVRYVLDD